jgi:hypothetical protein
METDNSQELRQWVAKQTAHLDPPARWRPDSVATLMRLHARMETHRPAATRWRWLACAAAAALVATLLLLLPAGRMVAQQVWQFLTVRQATARFGRAFDFLRAAGSARAEARIGEGSGGGAGDRSRREA